MLAYIHVLLTEVNERYSFVFQIGIVLEFLAMLDNNAHIKMS